MKTSFAVSINSFALSLLMLAVPAASRADDLYVSNFGNGTISKVSTTDGSVSTFASGLSNPEGLAFDSSGRLYVALQSGGIDRISSVGNVSQFASNFGYDDMNGVAFDSSGNLYVAATGSTNSAYVSAILKLNSQGVLVNSWRWLFATSSGPLQPTGLAFDSTGNLFVTDYSGNALWSISPSGVPTKITPMSVNPLGLAFDKQGNLFVGNLSSWTIDKVTPSFAVSTFASGIDDPQGLAFDAAGNLYVANSPNDAVGTTLTRITPDGTASVFATGLNRPAYIAVQVPEPSTWVMLVLGVGALLGNLRLRRRSS
jgi:hypothetical protein